MRTMRVLCGAAVTAAVVSLVAACTGSPTAPETGARAASRSLVSAPASESDTTEVWITSISADEQPADTSGTRRGGQMLGGGNFASADVQPADTSVAHRGGGYMGGGN